jgi:hypothetical protein
MHRDLGIRIDVIYKDVHLLEVRISASNGAFGGAADVYLELDHLAQTAGRLEGFPRNSSDVREATFGSFGPESLPGRRVNLRFYCADKSGHAYVDSMIESDYNAVGKIQCVTLSLPIEAAAVDRFVEDIAQMGAKHAGTAFLKACEAFGNVI